MFKTRREIINEFEDEKDPPDNACRFKGYRQLEEDEIVCRGDMCMSKESYERGCATLFDRAELSIGYQASKAGICYFFRRID